MDGRDLPNFVLDVLSLGPKHLLRDKFNEVQFLADVDMFVLEIELRETKTVGEKLGEIETSSKCYYEKFTRNPDG